MCSSWSTRRWTRPGARNGDGCGRWTKRRPRRSRAFAGRCLKNPWNLTPTQSQRLSTLQHDNGRLYRAYLLKETFAGILDRHQPNVVTDKLTEWLSWASRSRLPGFVKVARTIRRHLNDIVAYIRWGVTNGIVEGLHNKVRVITRRAYGFHSASALIGMIMLCLHQYPASATSGQVGTVTHTNFRRATFSPFYLKICTLPILRNPGRRNVAKEAPPAARTRPAAAAIE